MLNRDQAPLRSAMMIRVAERYVFACFTKQPGQNANAIDQQTRICGLVDRSFDDGRVTTQAPAIVDALRLGVADQRAIDALECLGAHELDVALERRLLWRLL